ncbi:enoyl-CoA hydratase protein (plasmid) [Rhizobium gallicum]|uniref:Enoyl-CoA hydratase protein n=1 Tax=Rhizobium gallicum TaxID=56730 RepID=A0A1L5NS34_9HYPH|nr:enoyl-CoA hydratase-related protein [Rhizobium gallicum]APO70682.1 enoyl-CoA hydratase protein [Rhizobium gallicum]
MPDLLLERHEKTLLVTLNRPEKLNALTMSMHQELLAMIDQVDRDDTVRAVVVTGTGKGFCSGTDLTAGGFSRVLGEDALQENESPVPRDKGGIVTLRIFRSNKPFIAAVNGSAVGMGAAITLPMDIRIGTSSTRYIFPYVRRGIVPESCSSWFLPRVAGLQNALDWMQSGRPVAAEELLAAGVLREKVEAEDLVPRALEIAQEIATGTSGLGVALTRRLIWQGMIADHPMISHRHESRGLVAMAASGDPREGVAAFVERRIGVFQSRPSALLDDPTWWDDRTYEQVKQLDCWKEGEEPL